MTAFNFRPNFVPLILSGKKLSTIRSTKRCDVGDAMQLYVGQRTKACKKLMDVTCIGVAPILVTFDDPFWKIGEMNGNVRPAHTWLHEQEGFINLREFLNFFSKQYGLPYAGFIHAWGKQ